MPPVPKPWTNFPAIVTQIDAQALTGFEYRVGNYVGSSGIGTGVAGYTDFQVLQAGGGSLTVNVGPATGGIQSAFLPGDANGGTERWDYAGPQLVATAAAADPTNPRIDLVTLAPNANPDLATPQVLIVKGTPTAGATLQTRTGAPAVPAGRILLGDLLVAAGATTILTAQIGDRRAFPLAGVNPGPFSTNGADIVVPENIGGLPMVTTGIVAGTNDNRASAMLVWLPRRILANRIRWRYRQGTTAATSNYQWVLFDASGRLILASALTAFAGLASAGVPANVPFVSGPVQLEAGAYYLGFQVAALTASSAPTYLGFNGAQVSAALPGVCAPNMFAIGSPGTILGAANTRMQDALGDAYNLTADGPAVPIPACAIGA